MLNCFEGLKAGRFSAMGNRLAAKRFTERGLRIEYGWSANSLSIMQQSDIAIPILPSRSLNDTLSFYRRLGFDGKVHDHGDYAIVTLDTLEIHFFTHRELCPAESSAMCYLRVSDVERIYSAFALARLPRKGIPRQDALEEKPWGMREFAIVDPDGNLIRIGQKL